MYRASRAGDDAVVALKIARRRGDPRFERECDALRVVGSMIAPRLIDTGTTRDGRPWIALEYLRGATLGAWMAGLPGTGACEPDHALSLLVSIAEIVDRMHAAGVVHRDLTPDNIIGGRGERVALLDFGLAMLARDDSQTLPLRDLADDRLTATGQRLGTVLYTAPEQLADPRTAGAPADRYALAAVAFELLTGRPPFIGTSGEVEQAHVARRVPPVSALASLPSQADRVFARALAKDPLVRHPSAAGFVSELARALDRCGPDAIADTEPAPRPVAPTSLRVAVLGTHAAVGAAAVAVAVAEERGRLVRIWGDRVIVAFDHADSPAGGIRAALRAARAIPAPLRVVVHVVEADLRRGAGRTRLASRELDAPGWLPSMATWEQGLEPIVLTEAAGAELSGYGDAASAPGYLVPPVEDAPAVATERVALRGCDRLIEALTREARHCMGAHVPGLSSLTGDVGLGKSRIVGQLAETLAASGRVVMLRTSEPGARAPLLVRLASLALGVDVLQAAPDALRMACERVAGPRRGHRAWQALTERLGPLSDEVSAPMPVVPGAARIAVAELIAAGLRRIAREQPLAMLIDDSHLADAVCLDALEIATLDDDNPGPWILLAGSPVLLATRPDIGQRAGRYSSHTLSPLDPNDARALLRDLLYPVERTPDATLAAIEQMARGVPLYLVEIVDALRAGGAVRRRRGTGAWFLASDDLLHLSSTPLAERLARRKLEALPMALRSFAVTTAVLGGEFQVEHVDAVRVRVESSDVLDYGDLDSSVAIVRLAHQGLLRDIAPGRYEFRHPMLRAGLEAGLDAERRRRIHGAVYNWLLETVSAPTADVLARRAHHASASGYRRASARAWLAAARADARSHEYVRAEQRYTAAIEQLIQLDTGPGSGDVARSDDATRRMAALVGRAKMRSRLERWDEALADLDEAFELARALGDDRMAADCLLDKGTVLDWTHRWAEAAECIALVGRQVSSSDADPGLEARLHLARGRCAYRDDRFEDAIAMFEAAADTARECDDHETRVVALLLLSTSLIYLARPADAEARFDEVVALCESTGDVQHLAAALANRIVLWQSLGQVDRALADGRRTVELARTLGHTTLEGTAGHNLAELLYFRGETDEALALATRARDLYHRHVAVPGPECDLLVARIRAALGEDLTESETLRALRSCPEDTWSDLARLAYDALTLAGDDRAGWSAVVDRARSVCRAFPDERLDILVMAMRTATSCGRRDDVRTLLAEARSISVSSSQLWSSRLLSFETFVTA